jgi:hypothetical protein
VNADNKDKTYGDSDPVLTYTPSGTLYHGDDYSVISGVVLQTATGSAATAGKHIITAGGGTADNYNIIHISGELNVEKRDLNIITFTANDKVYDGTVVATADTSTWITDAVYSEVPVFDYVAEFDGADHNEDQAPRTVSFSDIALTSSVVNNNYNLITQSGNATANISKKPLTITAVSKSKTYGEIDPVHEATYDTFVPGENAQTLGEVVIYRVVGENAGEYDTNIIIFDEEEHNYDINFVTGIFTIERKLLTISGRSAQSKTYDGDDLAVVDGTLNGVKTGDDVTLVLDDAVFDSKHTGENKNVYVNQYLTGPDADNYTLTTYSPYASADIYKKTLTISNLSADNKIYDGSTDVVYSFDSDIPAGDDFTLLYTVSFVTKNVGENIDVILSVTGIAGDDKDNYELNTMSLSTKADILPRNLIVENAVAQNKIYDGGTDAIISGATLSGFVVGDDVVLNNHTAGAFSQKDGYCGNHKHEYFRRRQRQLYSCSARYK